MPPSHLLVQIFVPSVKSAVHICKNRECMCHSVAFLNKDILQNAIVVETHGLSTTLFSNVQSTRFRIDYRTSYLFNSQ